MLPNVPDTMRSRVRLTTQAFSISMLVSACASMPAAPDRSAVGRALDERHGTNAVSLAAPAAWTVPPGISLERPLSVEDAVTIALWNNQAYHAALASLGIARADLIQAGTIRNPALSLFFPWGPKQLEAAVSWPIEQLWQRPARMRESQLNAEAVAQNLVGNGLALIADVKLAYAENVAASAGEGLASDQATLAGQLADLADGRYRAGDISDLDRRLARIDAVQLQAAALGRATARNLAMSRLRALLGLTPEGPEIRLGGRAPSVAPACASRTSVIKTALAARPDVRAAELAIEAAGARAGLARDSIFTVTAILDMNGEGREGFEAGPGIGAELPIFSQQQGARTRAAAELEQASRRYLAVRAAIVAELDVAWIQRQEADRVRALFGDEAVRSLGTERAQAEGLFEAGEISLLDLLQTRQRLIDVDLAKLDADLAIDRATIRLEQAVGRSCAE
jgi:cobalt-zinc-cadmium efflux system outer membrane protein